MRFWAVLCALTLASIARSAPAAEPSISYLKKLTLEELLDLEVTTVSRRAERFAEAASAITVLSDEEIQRSGATTLADLMRLATGLHVARSDGRAWAIASRGFNLVASNKLLVLLDGRSLYTPLFSGVLWDAQDTLLADLDRIEIVRGPGATMWGANAVNGVINIQSKAARDTVGTLIIAGGGNEERRFAMVRHGVQLGEGVHARVYVKEFQRDDLVFANGQDAGDDWRMWQGGFRLDAARAGRATFGMQGDLYRGLLGGTNRRTSRIQGGNILGRFSHDLGSDRSLSAQLYYDHVERMVPLQFWEKRRTIDFDTQFNFGAAGGKLFTAGVHARSSADRTGRDGTVRFDPPDRRITVLSGFVQYEADIHEKLGLTGGVKFEHHSSSGFEFQPSLRAAWRPTNHTTVWTAVSRAVRTPTRLDDDLQVVPAANVVAIRGDPEFRSEKMTAVEAGYRVNLPSKWAFDVSLFYNRYDELRSQEPSSPSPFPFVLRNKLNAETWGGEASLMVQVNERLRTRAMYSRLHKRLWFDSGSADPTGGAAEGNDPRDIVTLTALFDLSKRWQFDATVRHVGALPNPVVPSYTALDVRVGWRPTERWELSAVGQNLLDRSHREFGAQSATAREVERSIYGKVTWRF